MWRTSVLVLLAAGLLVCTSARAQDEVEPPIGIRVLGGVAAEGQVWLWTAQGGLAAVNPSDNRIAVRYNSGVSSAFADGRGLHVLRWRGRSWAVTTLHGGSSSETPALRAPSHIRPLAFFGDGAAFLVLTERVLFRFEGGRWSSKRLRGGFALFRGGTASTVRVDRTLYIGWNAGEFGGSIQRLNIDSGRLESPHMTLPVTAMVADPERPGCAIASMGVSHIGDSGEIDRICGRRLERVLVVPATVPPRAAPGEAQEINLDTAEPFWGLAITRGVVWTVGSLGLRRLDRLNDEPVQFPQLAEVGGIPMSFAAPGLLILQTDLNAERSLSGETPLMIGLP